MKPLLLLHGAIGAASQLTGLAAALGKDYKVYTMNFSGHGGRAPGDAPFSIDLFANDVLRFLEANNLADVAVFGYSMGGYVAMYIASRYAGKIGSIITLGTKYHWDEATAAKEVQMLNPEKIAQKVPAFAERLRALHEPNDWQAVLHNTADMMVAMGHDAPLKPDNYAAISCPVHLLLGAEDKMVSLTETEEVQRLIPGTPLDVLRATPHPIEQVDVQLLAAKIRSIAG